MLLWRSGSLPEEGPGLDEGEGSLDQARHRHARGLVCAAGLQRRPAVWLAHPGHHLPDRLDHELRLVLVHVMPTRFGQPVPPIGRQGRLLLIRGT